MTNNNTVKKVSTKELNALVYSYIINAIDGENYNVTLNTTEEKLSFLYNTFKKEYGWAIARYGEYKAFSEWLMGLPSSINIAFTNYDILEIAYNWGSLNINDTESRKDKIVNNWFNFVTVKTFQLFRKYKIVK